MGAAARVPGPVLSPLIEWRAGHIGDPIDRLRFLRQATRSRPWPDFSHGFHRAGGWRLVVTAVLWASFLIPAHSPTRARGSAGLLRMADPAASASAVVWPVEHATGYDLYSNGLRIENTFAVDGKPRKPYPVFRSQLNDSDAAVNEPMEWRMEPAGIVFHSTESLQAPFEASEARMLQRIGRNLLDYVRSQHSYHFVIDRFGRVFRVVSETSIANHSGKSVWADSRSTYVNLNASFLSVAFEAQTDASMPLSSAQMHSARILTDMLRGKFGIPAFNCVTHAQVSVNSWNWRIGYHTDWASGFPFSALGLPDNYAQAVPSMTLYGFDYDDAFLSVAGRPWAGLLMAHELVNERARAHGISVDRYRERLREKYRTIMNSAQLRSNEESKDESFQQD